MSTRRNIWSRCGHFQAEDATHCDNPDCRAVEVETDDTPRLGHVVDGKVTILGVLGKGGMGTVYRAFQHSVAREVALKVLNQRADDADGKQARSFLKEAGSASRLSHPNIISVYDVGQSPDGELYLIMERLDGNPLSTVLKQDGPLAPERAVAIAIQVCDALHEAHEQGVIHRDLKPSNIFIRPGAGRYGEFAKVLDFGIAKLQKVDGAESISHTGIVSGTPSYMCPEQILGKAVDRRVDVYALGVIVYMMLTGERPVPKGTQVETLLAHLNDPPAPIATRNPEVAVPPALAELVMACLEKEPDDRPASTLAVKRRLQAWLDGGKAAEAGASPAAAREAAGHLEQTDEATLDGEATLSAAHSLQSVLDAKLVADAAKKPTNRSAFVFGMILLGAGAGYGIYHFSKPPQPAVETKTAAAESRRPPVVKPIADAPPAPVDRGPVTATGGAGSPPTVVKKPAPKAVSRRMTETASVRPPLALEHKTPPAPAAVKAVEVTIKVRGNVKSKVYRGTEDLGNTPLKLERPAKGTQFILDIRPENKQLQSQTLVLKSSGDSEVLVTLRKKPLRKKKGGTIWK